MGHAHGPNKKIILSDGKTEYKISVCLGCWAITGDKGVYWRSVEIMAKELIPWSPERRKILIGAAEAEGIVDMNI